MSNTGLFCSQCGELNDAQAKFCRKCGAVQPNSGGALTATAPASVAAPPSATTAPTPAMTTPPAYTAAATPQTALAPASPGAAFATPVPVFAPSEFAGYGGFWLRVLATIIDSLLLGVVIVPLLFVLIAVFGVAGSVTPGNEQAAMAAMLTLMPLFIIIPVGIGWLYEAYMTSSSKQATLGHLALHMKVVNRNGQRLSFGHATGRYFAKMINNFTLYIGWLLVAFTERKQGLHDIIAGTYIVKTR